MKNVIARVILILFLITALGAGVLFGAYKYLDSVDYDAKIEENIGKTRVMNIPGGDLDPIEPEAKAVEVKEEGDYEDSLTDSGIDISSEIYEKDADPATDMMPPEEGVKYFYYDNLLNFEKQVYSEVYNSLVNREPVRVSTISKDTLDKAFKAVIYDHPELFYVERYMYTTYTRGSTIVYMEFEGKYNYSKEEAKRIGEEIEKNAKEIIAGVDKNADDYEKIRYVFERLSDDTTYSTTSVNNQNMASVLYDHVSSCAGYSKATQYLLNMLGINAFTVTGDAAGGAHAWNMVKADGNWYHLDVTWGDMDFQENMEGSVDKAVMTYNYDYFLVTTSDIKKSHRPDELVLLPECTSQEDNYYVREDLYYTEVNPDKIRKAFEKGYEDKDNVVRMKCADKTIYNAMKSYLLDDQNVFDYVILKGKISYMDDPELYTFQFWL